MAHARFLAIAALAAMMPVHARAYGGEPTSSFCLAVDNARYPSARFISVEVDGYPGYWVIDPNQTRVLTASHSPDPHQDIRAESFTLHIYDGNEGRAGALIVTTTIAGDSNVFSPYTISTPVGPAGSDARTAPECKETGEWIVLVHD